jgi:putative oxidoreductase
VQLSISLEDLLSKPGIRVLCDACGEEALNEREVILEDAILCRACAGQSYYRSTEQESPKLLWQEQSEDCVVGWQGQFGLGRLANPGKDRCQR